MRVRVITSPSPEISPPAAFNLHEDSKVSLDDQQYQEIQITHAAAMSARTPPVTNSIPRRTWIRDVSSPDKGMRE